MAKGAGKDAASASVTQPQGVGGVTGGETWGKAETVGRRSRRMRVEVEMGHHLSRVKKLLFGDFNASGSIGGIEVDL